MNPKFYYRNNQRRTFGPFSVEQLKEGAATGRLDSDDTVWLEGADDTYKAKTVKGLFERSETPTVNHGDEVNIFLKRDDKYFGPYTLEAVKEFNLNPTDKISNNSNGPWVEIATQAWFSPKKPTSLQALSQIVNKSTGSYKYSGTASLRSFLCLPFLLGLGIPMAMLYDGTLLGDLFEIESKLLLALFFGVVGGCCIGIPYLYCYALKVRSYVFRVIATICFTSITLYTIWINQGFLSQKGDETYFFMVIESGIILAVIVLGFFDLKLPILCEKCNAWCEERENVWLIPGHAKTALLKFIDAQNFAGLFAWENHPIPPDDYLAISIWECNSCKNMGYLTISHEEEWIANNNKTEKTSSPVLDNLRLSPEILELINTQISSTK
jgi:hypothetical protein